jgi:hypothetical protein
MHQRSRPRRRTHRPRGWRIALVSTIALTGGLTVSTASTSTASTAPTAADSLRTAPRLPSLTGVVLVEKLSASNSVDKSVTVSCPSGKKVISAGGSIASGYGHVALDDMYPNDALTSVTATGLETDSYNGNWMVRAAATCANPPSGLQRVRRLVEDSSSAKSVTATCPPGRTMLGTGASMRGGQGQAVMRSIRPHGGGPTSAADSVTVGAYETDPLAGSWTVLAYAICAYPLAGQKVLNVSSNFASHSTGGQVAYCEPSQVATGGGGDLFDPAGAVSLNTVTPVHPGQTASPRGIVALAAEEDATSSSWAVRTWVLCADE